MGTVAGDDAILVIAKTTEKWMHQKKGFPHCRLGVRKMLRELYIENFALVDKDLGIPARG